MDIEVTCNTDDATLIANIQANSAGRQWLKMAAPHAGHAVLVGSGPSLAECLDTLRWRKEQGQTVFALNNAANYLATQDIHADYQVIVDARENTASLIGPAKRHLLSSQVHPSLFARLPDAQLFQPAMEGIEAILPAYQDDYALIGGGTTVGLSAMCLAFAMGYRHLHLFGYDSCHMDDKSHVVAQAINNAEPWGTFEWRGKIYKGSITMIRQAELFQPIANNLMDMGCAITVDGRGLIPDIVRDGAAVFMSEPEKYRKMWEFEEYRHTAPGELCIDRFLEVVKPKANDHIIDFGCGTGRGSVRLAEAGFKPLLIDFTQNSRDAAALSLPFIQADLKALPNVWAKHGYCTDVMEHIDTPDVEAILESVMAHCAGCFFQISLVPDNMGALIGQELHLTVKPFEWWLDRFFSLGYALKHAKNDGISATFYVTR